MDRTLTAAGWAAATATSASLRGAVMSEFFEFEYLDLPHPNHEKAEYDAAVAAPETLERVKVDFDGGVALGVESTPTFFLNDRPLRLTSFDDLRAAIKAELQR